MSPLTPSACPGLGQHAQGGAGLPQQQQQQQQQQPAHGGDDDRDDDDSDMDPRTLAAAAARLAHMTSEHLQGGCERG
jgi:hypothetical protein